MLELLECVYYLYPPEDQEMIAGEIARHSEEADHDSLEEYRRIECERMLANFARRR